MSFNFSNIPIIIITKQDVNKLLKCNTITQQYGLQLTKQDALILAQNRVDALKINGRLEFKGGITESLIYSFCDSVFINKLNYVDVILELTQIFYYYKNECNDELSDEELMEFMKFSFNGKCHGSLELLKSKALALMLDNLKHGRDLYYVCDNEELEYYE
ncbi:hypothetical protein IMX26_15940 [Clostridium sp. 'deep sea']|uniref:DUF6323 family protein n=1 Tax=Clostridium sp. 'deep sea' TaxID=2779445 RepID=UPI0018969B5C|nr:DUF6323 family protein [Clostridium sp. 'deep sea']QOR34929.1 hypothetical protein IMX26_15940 [Clostridium sp. 'deep sea']